MRLWLLMACLGAGIAFGSGYALYLGVQELRLHAAGPRQQVLAEELDPLPVTRQGWMVVLGCARHDLEVAISPDGIVVAGERDEKDRIYIPLTPRGECAEDTPAAALHIKALVESADGGKQGLSRLYDQGYRPPPTEVLVEGVVGFGGGDGRAEYLAREEFGKRGLGQALARAPLLVKDRRPGSKGVAWATVAMGTHGLLLILFLCGLGLRRALRPLYGIDSTLLQDPPDNEVHDHDWYE